MVPFRRWGVWRNPNRYKWSSSSRNRTGRETCHPPSRCPPGKPRWGPADLWTLLCRTPSWLSLSQISLAGQPHHMDHTPRSRSFIPTKPHAPQFALCNERHYLLITMVEAGENAARAMHLPKKEITMRNYNYKEERDTDDLQATSVYLHAHTS